VLFIKSFVYHLVHIDTIHYLFKAGCPVLDLIGRIDIYSINFDDKNNNIPI